MLRFGLGVAASVLVVDQLTKFAVLAWLAEPVRVLPFLDLVLVWNPGISFGMLGAAGPWALIGLALAIVVLLLVWLRRSGSALTTTALGLVIGGALGNVIDRLRFGAVVDFVDLHALGWHWPAFNVADSAICIGAALLLLDGLRSPQRGHTRLAP